MNKNNSISENLENRAPVVKRYRENIAIKKKNRIEKKDEK